MLKVIGDLKFETCKGSNRYDKTIYISYSEAYKMLIKRVFSQDECYAGNFKITNETINNKINNGWNEEKIGSPKKKKECKHGEKNKGKKVVKKEKSLLYKKLAVSIIEDAGKVKMKGIVDEKKKLFKLFYECKKKHQAEKIKKEKKNSVLSMFKSNTTDKPDLDNNDDLFKEMDKMMNG